MGLQKSELKGRCLSFKMGGTLYGVPAVKVRGIFTAPQTTKVPNAPEFVVGVAAFHGAIAPVVDLSKRMGVTAGAAGNRQCAVSLNVHNDSDSPDMAVLVDEVADMTALSEENISEPPAGGNGLVLATAKVGDAEIQIIDIEKIFP